MKGRTFGGLMVALALAGYGTVNDGNAGQKAASAETKALVEIGPWWQIAIPEAGPDVPKVVAGSLKTAAEELQRDIAEASGVKLEIVPLAMAETPAIRLGAKAAQAAGIYPNDLICFHNVIAEKDGDIYLFGYDRPGRAGLDGSHWWLSGIPTVRAVTRFLQTRAGVKFLMPGATGTEVCHKGPVTLEVGTFDRENPFQESGTGRYNGGMIYCMANGIFGPGAACNYGGHSYQAAIPPALGKEHPEYFGLINGVRQVLKNQAPICISNPEVQDLMVQELVRRFDGGADVCQLAQQDGFRGCECEKCAAYGGPAAKDSWGEKLWILHCDIARRVAKLRPGKIVQMISYGPTTEPPHSFTEFPENVMVELCCYTESELQQWQKYKVPHGFSVYAYLWGEFGLPGLTPKFSIPWCASMAQRFRKYNIRRVYRCGYGELFGMEGPFYYVFNTLLEKPEADIRELMKEYCESMFGPASEQMLAFYNRLNTQLQLHSLLCPSSVLNLEGWDSLSAKGIQPYRRTYVGNSLPLLAMTYSPDAIKAMESLLAHAEKTPGLSAKAKARLEVVRLEWNYAKGLGQIATLYAAYKTSPTKESFRPLAAALRTRKALLDDIYAEGPKRPRAMKDYPEYRLFCPPGPTAYTDRAEASRNGHILATLTSPLDWDLDFMEKYGILPGAGAKRLIVKKAKTAPAMDGDATTGAWADADWQDLLGSQLQQISKKARMKLLYDDQALYFALESDLPDAQQVLIFEKAHDDNAWYDESLDVLVDPSSTRERYFHWIIGPTNGFYDDALGMIKDPLHPKWGKVDVDWNSKATTVRNRRANGKWTCLMRIPFTDLDAKCPSSGTVWCFNAGRTWGFARWRQHEDEYALWSPSLENRRFTTPEAMGEIVFE